MNDEPSIHLSVVIPAYNEADRIGPTLDQAGAGLAGWGRPVEIIVADDGSTDGTAAVVERRREGFPVPLRLVRLERNRGKGAAVRAGVAESRGAYILFSDADLSTPIGDAATLLECLEAGGADVAMGSRALPGSRITRAQGPHRQLAGTMFNRLVRLATGLPFRDTQCGFKLFRGACARELFAALQEERFAFDVEIAVRAVRRGFKVIEVPVEWADARGSRVRLLRDSARMALSLWRIRRTAF